MHPWHRPDGRGRGQAHVDVASATRRRWRSMTRGEPARRSGIGHATGYALPVRGARDWRIDGTDRVDAPVCRPPTFRTLSRLSLPKLVRALRTPVIKAAIVSEQPGAFARLGNAAPAFVDDMLRPWTRFPRGFSRIAGCRLRSELRATRARTPGSSTIQVSDIRAVVLAEEEGWAWFDPARTHREFDDRSTRAALQLHRGLI